MKSGVTISTAGHAILLAWGLVSFSAKPFDAATAEALPVDIISSSEFSQMTAGVKTAPKFETPKPLVEKVAPDPKPVKDPEVKVSEKPEIEAAKADAAPPVPQVKPQPEAKSEEKKPDEIAEALKKEVVKPPPAPKKPPPPKLDLSQIQNKLALLDKREQRRAAVTGETLNRTPTPTLGTSSGRSATLSQNEMDALRAQIQACWNPPAGAADAKNLVVKVRLTLNQDGSLSGEPMVVNRGDGFFQVAAESAMRAIRRCQPYKMPIAKYEVWRDVEVTFDPREMFRG